MDDLGDGQVGGIAAVLRAAVDPASSGLGDSTRESATLLHRAKDRDTVSGDDNMDFNKDIMPSSWAGMRCYHFDFGLGMGTPASFRRTKHGLVPSLMFLLPKVPTGEIVVSLCEREGNLQGVQEEETFKRLARYIG